jgi:hypothetical protein
MRTIDFYRCYSIRGQFMTTQVKHPCLNRLLGFKVRNEMIGMPTGRVLRTLVLNWASRLSAYPHEEKEQRG